MASPAYFNLSCVLEQSALGSYSMQNKPTLEPSEGGVSIQPEGLDCFIALRQG